MNALILISLSNIINKEQQQLYSKNNNINSNKNIAKIVIL